MKNKAKPNSENDRRARPLPVEEFALLVEGLSEADIEAMCAQDGALPGGVPPAWATRALIGKQGKCIEGPSPPAARAEPLLEWERARTCRIVARGQGLAALGIHDGDEFEVDGGAQLNEGDLVAVEGSGARLLRRLRHVGGARLLCSGNPDLPAVALDDDLRCLGVISLANRGASSTGFGPLGN